MPIDIYLGPRYPNTKPTLLVHPLTVGLSYQSLAKDFTVSKWQEYSIGRKTAKLLPAMCLHNLL